MGTTNEETAWATKLGAPKEWLDRENPRHEVRLRSFSMSATEVTREQFSEFVQQSRHPAEGFCYAIEENTVKMGGVRTWRDPGFPQAPDHPVVCVTHWDATEYVRWLSRITKHKYRLPSEAEWEYVARAGTATGRYWGWDDATACEFENVADNQFFATLKIPRPRKFASFSCSDGFAYTAPVGRFKPNAFGFYDMLGNVAEWTGDWWNVNYIGAPEDGSIWQAGDRNLRVFRGGAWIYYPRLVRSASRGRITATDRGDNVGFRVVRTD
ncbi:MAG: formylglycine-generating enzyme family protein [Alphaproteobacteria bacterium]|nr:formylglycine-generating enzyme family protein [Alphaproteobacteria bacterium]